MSRRRRGRRPWEPRTGAPQNGPPGRSGAPPGPRPPGAGPRGRGRWSTDPQTGARRWIPEDGPPRREHGRGAPPPAAPPRHSSPERAPAASGGAPLEPFELFCAYHLGITVEGRYRIQNLHEVARRFGTNAAALRQTLSDYGMAADDIVHSGFDLASAQLDIMVAPEGVSRRELARPLFEEFQSAPRRARNWEKEMEEAERAIETSLGREGRWSPAPRDGSGKQSS